MVKMGGKGRGGGGKGKGGGEKEEKETASPGCHRLGATLGWGEKGKETGGGKEEIDRKSRTKSIRSPVPGIGRIERGGRKKKDVERGEGEKEKDSIHAL